MVDIKKEKVYIAGPYCMRKDLRPFYKILENSVNIEPLGWWIFTEDTKCTEEAARRDIEEVAQCDRLIAFSGEGGHGGKHYEQGFAMGLGKEVDLIGPKEHVFHELSEINIYKNKEEWLRENIVEYRQGV